MLSMLVPDMSPTHRSPPDTSGRGGGAAVGAAQGESTVFLQTCKLQRSIGNGAAAGLVGLAQQCHDGGAKLRPLKILRELHDPKPDGIRVKNHAGVADERPQRFGMGFCVSVCQFRNRLLGSCGALGQ